EKQQMLLAAAKKAGVPVTFLSAGMSFSFGEVTVSCLHPSADFQTDSVNAYSAVLSLTYRSFSALFTGDLEEAQEQILLPKLSQGYDLLKVAHHGSRSSSSKDFLASIFDPDETPLAVISAGVKNVYGHPHIEVVNRLLSFGAEVYCTKNCGEICVEVDDNGNLRVKTKL
ncbi:MAG: competence protein ComEC, partial [Lachnospiraceae bacterium]|nr:competence protein ComEC [Lachnospiraceae bacterium]